MPSELGDFMVVAGRRAEHGEPIVSRLVSRDSTGGGCPVFVVQSAFVIGVGWSKTFE